jgi:hypothetical protein
MEDNAQPVLQPEFGMIDWWQHGGPVSALFVRRCASLLRKYQYGTKERNYQHDNSQAFDCHAKSPSRAESAG